jgi:TonB family protein
MVRPSSRFLAALAASWLVHAIGALLFWLLRGARVALPDPEPAPEAIAIDVRPAEPAAPSGLVVVVPGAPDAVEPPGSAPAVPGDRDRAEALPSAPTAAENSDRFAVAPAPSSGSGPGVPRTDVTGRRDEQDLRVQLYDADDGFRLQRIRTGDRRVSREDVRATPNPGFLPDLASRRGEGEDRRAPGAKSLGAPDGARAAARREGLSPESAPGDDRAARQAASPERGGARIGKDGEEATGFARPLIAAGPAATDAGRRSIEVADRTDSSMRSSELHPGRIELTHPGPLGPGDSGRGAGALPAWASHGRGEEAVPAGDPHAPRGDELRLAEYHRRYNQYLSDVKRKVHPLWEMPREMVLKLEQGDVLVGYTIRRDGTVKDVKVLKTSGWKEFDQNVVAAIRRAAPFGRLPEVFGDELRVTSMFEGANPVVR